MSAEIVPLRLGTSFLRSAVDDDLLAGVRIATVGLTPGFHPLIVPSSAAKMKAAAPEACAWVFGFTPLTVKSVPPLGVSGATIPVGIPAPPAADGMLTTRPFTVTLIPVAVLLMVYSVDTPVALSLTQKGLVILETRPHALTRWASSTVPPVPKLVTKSVRVYCAKLKEGSRKANAKTAIIFIADFILFFSPMSR